jgi:hypothetical protein
LTAEEQRLSLLASSQKDRSLQSKARQASQASSSQVSLFHQSFLHVHHFWLEKEASDTMLVAATGCTDAFWRPSAWYLNILADLLPKPCLVKMEEMEKNIVRMEKLIVRMEKLVVKMEKIIVYSWQIWSCDLAAVTRGHS